MMISTRGRYALRLMIDLAEQPSDRFTPLREIAARQEISEKYLEGIVKSLVQSGLLTGLRGKKGGYRMTKKPSEYTVYEILSATEEDLSPVSCLEPGTPACPRADGCRTISMWKNLDQMIIQFFSEITLEKLMEDSKQAFT